MNAAGTTMHVAGEFRAICGAQYVVEDPAELHHRLILGLTPSVEVQPGSADEVAAILRVANEQGSASFRLEVSLGSRPEIFSQPSMC